MLLTVNLGNWIIFEKYLRMNNLGGLSAEDNPFHLLQRVKVETHFPREDPFLVVVQDFQALEKNNLLSTNYL